MRRALPLLPFALAGCSVSIGSHDDRGGVAPSGSGTERSYAVSGFSKVALAGADDAEVTVGPAFAVTASGPSDQLDQLRIDRNGDTLEIGRRRGTMSWGKHPPVTIRVTLPAMSGASLSGSGDMRVDGVHGGSFTAQATGSGDLTLHRLAVDAAAFSIAGSGAIVADGSAKSLDVDISGSGELRGPSLAARQAKLNIAGSGSASARVDGEAQVSLLGSGDADLGPKARCKVDKLGSGEAHCGA